MIKLNSFQNDNILDVQIESINLFCNRRNKCKCESKIEILLTNYHIMPHFDTLNPFPNNPWFLCVYSTSLV